MLLKKCLLLSPIVDMEKLIKNMMLWSNITINELKEKREIITPMTETLSWDYYQFAINNPVNKWESPTFIFCGSEDKLTEQNIIKNFAKKFNCDLTILQDAEHYLYTEYEQQEIKNWIKKVI